jgi:hypothetical protein
MQELIFKGAFILTKYAIVTKFKTVVCSIEKNSSHQSARP